MHLVPEQLCSHWILAHDDGLERFLDDVRMVVWDWSANSNHAFICLDLNKCRVDAVVIIVKLVCVTVGPDRAVLRVDIEWHNQPLFPECAVGLHGTADFAKFDIGDLHIVPLFSA